MRISLFIGAIGAALLAGGPAHAVVTYGQAALTARVTTLAQGGQPQNDTTFLISHTLATNTFGPVAAASSTRPNASSSGTASTKVTFDDATGGTLNLDAAVTAVANGGSASAFAYNDFYYEFVATRNFTVSFLYEISTAAGRGVLPNLQFDLSQSGGTPSLFNAGNVTGSGMRSTGLFGAGAYRLRITQDTPVGTSASDVEGPVPESLSGNIGFAITEAAGVPEPSTWAMLLAGFGLVGVAARRRRSLVTA